MGQVITFHYQITPLHLIEKKKISRRERPAKIAIIEKKAQSIKTKHLKKNKKLLRDIFFLLSYPMRNTHGVILIPQGANSCHDRWLIEHERWQGGSNLRHSSRDLASKLSQYCTIICSNTGNQASCRQLR